MTEHTRALGNFVLCLFLTLSDASIFRKREGGEE